MQSASPSGRLQLGVARLREGAQQSVSGGQLWTVVLIVLFSYVVARSTATAEWVDGIDVISGIAVGGSIVAAVFALSPLPWSVGVVVCSLAGPVVSVLAAWPRLHAAHPLDSVSWGLVTAWWTRITNGDAASDPSFYLAVICLLMWVSGAWLSWAVLRWRKTMLGLIPGAAAFSTNVLNYPADQNGYTLLVLVLVLALLLWTTYTGSVVNAAASHLKLTGDARWDFWETGLAVTAALIVLGVLLPPLSTADRTAQMESSLFSNWAQLQATLNHIGRPGGGGSGGGGGSSGFSTSASLGGPLQLTHDEVFTYTVSGVYDSPYYFRGVNLTETAAGAWEYTSAGGSAVKLGTNTIPPYTEQYSKLAVASFTVHMATPPSGNSDVLFYPGTLLRVNRGAVAVESPAFPGSIGLIDSIDRLGAVSPSSSAGTYQVDSEYSTATTADLENAGTDYPAWVLPLATLPAQGYRTADALQHISDLARQVVGTAQNPYDEASAIEAWLRSTNFAYTLQPQQAPQGADPLVYFLEVSRQGYCQYFATAMGDMLRSLGVPTRLVNGFGPGQYNSTIRQYVVRNSDAHTWVESYFPGYGWIAFDPTNDTVYHTIPRGTNGANLCLRDNGCDIPLITSTGLPATSPTTGGGRPGIRDVPQNAGGGLVIGPVDIRAPDSSTLTRLAAIAVALLLLLLAGLSRYLRPRTVAAAWQRTRRLARLAGAKGPSGETPRELGRRLQSFIPEAADAIGSLASGFTIAAYAPPDLAPSARSAVMDAWGELRPALLRRVLMRLRRSGLKTA